MMHLKCCRFLKLKDLIEQTSRKQDVFFQKKNTCEPMDGRVCLMRSLNLRNENYLIEEFMEGRVWNYGF